MDKKVIYVCLFSLLIGRRGSKRERYSNVTQLDFTRQNSAGPARALTYDDVHMIPQPPEVGPSWDHHVDWSSKAPHQSCSVEEDGS